MDDATPPDLPPPYRTVVFDCDSTLSRIEGIDELAGPRLGELRALTDRAMAGELPLEDVYAARLDRIRPSRSEVEAIGQRYVETQLPGVSGLVRELLERGVEVHILSGGLLPAVRVLGRALGLADDRIHAVDLKHAANGAYVDFDRASPLARSGGKPDLLRTLGIARPAALVGDGMTDLECWLEGAVDRFVAFTGVAERDAVVARTPHRLQSFEGPEGAALLLGDD